MPVHMGKDSKGCYAQWGGQKKYYYACGSDAAKARALRKAHAQESAAKHAGYTENAMFQYVVTNIKPTVRHDQMEGRDYLVTPAQMITEGVHDGSDGPIFYPADELAKPAVVWNHKPVVVYHPQRNGMPVSACDPTELTTRKVGVLMNTVFNAKTKKLGAEAWLEPDRIAAVDERVADAIENNEMMEVSTGLFMNLDKTPGEWNGEKYVGVARNIQPDHLAILPDVKGACSIEDGAGLLRVNASDDGEVTLTENDVDVTDDYVRIKQKSPGLFKKETFRTVWLSESKGINSVQGKLKNPSEGEEGSMVLQSYLFVKEKWTVAKAKAWVKAHKGTTSNQVLLRMAMNELSYDSVQTLLRGALRAKKVDSDAWVTDVFDAYFIYEEGGKLYRQDYAIKKGAVTFAGLPKPVERRVTYEEVKALAANAAWTGKYVNDLPDSAFLYVEPGGKKDSEGKTVPRGNRHFPYKDANGEVDLPHLRNALARIPQSNVPASVKKRCTARAKSVLAKVKPTNSSLKGMKMDKERMVDALIDNEKTSWTEDQRELLMNLDDAVVTNMHTDVVELEKAAKDAADAANVKSDKSQSPPADQVQNQPQGQAKPSADVRQQAMQFIENASGKVKEFLEDGIATMDEKRKSFIDVIVANERNQFTKEGLELRSVRELQAIAALAKEPESKLVDNALGPVPMYHGQQGVTNDDSGTVEPLKLPVMNFGEQKQAS